MTQDDTPEAFLNAFECTTEVAGWFESQRVTFLIPCLVGLAHQAIDILPAADAMEYKKVRKVILQTLHLSPKVYQRWLHEIESGHDYHPSLMEKCVQAAYMRLRTAKQIVEAVMIAHYTSILPFNSKTCALCLQPMTFEEAFMLIEVYASAKAGLYLILKA